MQFRPNSAMSSPGTSPFKMEWSLEARATDCQRMLAKHPGRVPMIVERSGSVPELSQGAKLLLPSTVTVSQALRVIRNKAGLGRECRLQLHVNGISVGHHLLVSDVHNAERDEDGFLYCNYSMDEASSTRRSKTEEMEWDAKKVQVKEHSSWYSWAPTSMYSWTPTGGWSVKQRAAGPKEDAGGEVELMQVYSKKEQRARNCFQKKMRKRAAGPREAAPEQVSNTKLKQALASCKLDTALSGMIQVASKNGASPGTCASTSSYQCGMPCALRVHTVRPA